MSKELEALKFIKNVEVWIGNDHNTATKVFDISNDYDECFRIIEKALKEKVQLEKIVKRQIETIAYYQNLALEGKLERDKKFESLKKHTLSINLFEILILILH